MTTEFRESGPSPSGSDLPGRLRSFLDDLRRSLRQSADGLRSTSSGLNTDVIRRLPRRAMDWFRDLSSIPKLVLVGLVLLVLLVILSPLAAFVAGVLLGASVIALIIRVVQKGSIENYGWWPWANPLIFALVCILVSTMLAALVGLSFSLIGGMQGAASAFGRLLLSVIFYPLLAVAGLFVGAGIYHLLLGLVVGQQRLGFGTTLRVYTYTSVALLIAWIPVLGWLLAPIWSVLLAIFGIREAHNTPTSKAALVVLIPPAVVLLFLFLLLAILLILSRLL